jgi:hypothetical protein
MGLQQHHTTGYDSGSKGQAVPSHRPILTSVANPTFLNRRMASNQPFTSNSPQDGSSPPPYSPSDSNPSSKPLADALSQAGYTAVLINQGKLNAPSLRLSGSKILFWNGPNAIVDIGDPAPAIVCGGCDAKFNSSADYKDHKLKLPLHCTTDKECFKSWQEHVDAWEHTTCPLPSCSKGSVVWEDDDSFMEHWREKHVRRKRNHKRSPFFGR